MFPSHDHEDWVRIHRVQFLGYDLCRTEGVLYHLTHSRTFNSSGSNPYYNFNGQEIQRIKRLNKEQILNEIKKWKWKDDIKKT